MYKLQDFVLVWEHTGIDPGLFNELDLWFDSFGLGISKDSILNEFIFNEQRCKNILLGFFNVISWFY